jgi:hypothetical protein
MFIEESVWRLVSGHGSEEAWDEGGIDVAFLHEFVHEGGDDLIDLFISWVVWSGECADVDFGAIAVVESICFESTGGFAFHDVLGEAFGVFVGGDEWAGFESVV